MLALRLLALISLLGCSEVYAREVLLGEHQLRVGEHVVLLGGLSRDGISEIGRQGMTFVELRQSDEDIAAHHAQLQAAGVQIVHIPLGREAPAKSDVARLEALVRVTDRQVVLNCSSGNRAGLLWASLLKTRGASTDDALKAVAAIVTRDPIREAIGDFEPAKETK